MMLCNSWCFLLRCFCIVGIDDMAILTVLAFVSWNYLWFLVFILCIFLMIGTISLVFLFSKHFSANHALKIVYFPLSVGRFKSSNASLYGCLFLSIKLTATFWTLSMSFSFCFVVLEPQTAHDCSRLFVINILYI